MRLPLGKIFASVLAAAVAMCCVSCSDEGKANTGSRRRSRHAGATSQGGTSAVVFEDEFERVWLEAEDAVKIEGNLMRIAEERGASRGKCLEIPDKAGTPKELKFARAIYRFAIKKPAFYTFWCRRKWHDRCGDTFAVRFDQVGRSHTEACLFGADDSSEPPRWGWTPVRENGNPRQFFLSAGEHVMEILNREDGPRLDLILLTEDRDYVPTDSEELPNDQ